MTSRAQRTRNDAAKGQAALKDMLSARRREVEAHVHRRLRDGRTEHGRGKGDDIDHADAHAQADMELALLQMRSDTLTRIDAALVRIDAGAYGSCFECGDAIAEQRLRALPFAVRCRDCEDRREQERGQQAQRPGGLSIFQDPTGP